MRFRLLYGVVSWIFLFHLLPYFFRSDVIYSRSSRLQANTSFFANNTSSIADLRTLVNFSDFQFTLMSPPCQGSRTPFILFIVHTAPGHVARRQAIRETWGSRSDRVVFLVGQVTDGGLQHSLEAESVRFNDLVQGNFLDSYRNLTYKQVMGLKWVTFFCPRASYVFKVDDDVFIDVPQLTTYLRQSYGPEEANFRTLRSPSPAVPSSLPSLLLCYVVWRPYAKRSYRSKWRVTFREYRHAYYPPYCSGFVVGMSNDVVIRLHRASFYEPYFWIDDVYVSGILAAREGIQHVDLTDVIPATSKEVKRYLESKEAPLRPPPMFGAPDLDVPSIRQLWQLAQRYYNP